MVGVADRETAVGRADWETVVVGTDWETAVDLETAGEIWYYYIHVT